MEAPFKLVEIIAEMTSPMRNGTNHATATMITNNILANAILF